MFSDQELTGYAEVLLWGLQTARRGKFRRNDTVAIRYHLPARPLAEILYDKLLRMGLNPLPRAMETPGMEKSFFSHATPSQLAFVPAGEENLQQHLNGSIHLYAPESITHLGDIDPRKIGQAAVARKYLRDILNRREEQGLFSWTLCMFPTMALARHARMSLKAYARQIAAACFLEESDPVRAWQDVHHKIRTIKKRLDRLPVERLHIESANIDLTITVGEKRKWLGLSGRNIPSFEIFTSPDWRGTSGVYYADQPSFRSGNLVAGVRLEFNKGAVVKVAARKGEDFVRRQIEMDPGARRVGEFSLTDKRFSRIDAFMANTLFDENFGGPHGNCHLALGSAYTDAYAGKPGLDERLRKKLGFNDSALHWDLVNTESKRVSAILTGGGRRVVYANGEFV
ncbi:MAG: aminopeptidase [Desulfobacterales bacterium]